MSFGLDYKAVKASKALFEKTCFEKSLFESPFGADFERAVC